MNEFDWIELIKKRAGRLPAGWIGIGDDAAVIPGNAAKNWVVSTDAIVEGVDFDHTVTAAQAGRKALAINLSDLAAMGAVPAAFLMTLGVPKIWNGTKLKQFIGGVFKLAEKFNVPCIGGDMTSAAQFFCSITVFGRSPSNEVVLRSGAKPGDLVLVTGRIGGSIKKKHYDFNPRVKEAEWLVKNFKPSAMMDISDGLTQDLGHLLTSSQCMAQLNLDLVPVSKDAKNRESALSDGEDFELLMTVHPKLVVKLLKAWEIKFPEVELTPIGHAVAGKPRIEFFLKGVKQLVRPGGFKHF